MENIVAKKEFRDFLLSGYGTSATGNSFAVEVYPYEVVSSTMDIAQSLSRGQLVDNEPLVICFANSFSGDSCNESLVLPQVKVVLARSQNAGRGRYGRLWHSTMDAGLYLSFIFPYPRVDVSGFSLALGLAVVDACSVFGVSAGLKWPNDVIVAFPPPRGLVKLSGILVEATGQALVEGHGFVIAGIGLNIRSCQSLLDVNGVALEEIVGCSIGYDEIFRVLLAEVLRVTNKFYQFGFSPFAKRWNSLSLMVGRTVSWDRAMAASCRGTVIGVDLKGGLIVNTQEGQLTIYGGEVVFE